MVEGDKEGRRIREPDFFWKARLSLRLSVSVSLVSLEPNLPVSPDAQQSFSHSRRIQRQRQTLSVVSASTLACNCLEERLHKVLEQPACGGSAPPPSQRSRLAGLKIECPLSAFSEAAPP